jgi:hypothetical protein
MLTYTEKLTIILHSKVLKMSKILVFINSC